MRHADTDREKDVERAAVDLSRREFLALTGSGLFVLFWIGPADAIQEPARIPARQGYPTDFNAYLKIGADGRVTCFVGKVELGQGAMTSLAMLLAEELDVALDSVDMVMGDTDVCPWDMGTFGSLSIWQFGPVLRGAGAEARAVLLQMASEQLQVPVDQLQVKAGAVTRTGDAAKRVTYAQLVQGKRIERHLEKIPVKSVSAFSIVGKSAARKDALEKVTGRAKYAGDIAFPDLLHARIVRPPAHGARLTNVDAAAAEKIEGVRVVRDGDLIAVLHERRDVADKALDLVQAQFDRPAPTFDDKTIFDHLVRAAPQGQVVPDGESGSLQEGEKLASTIVDETYLNSYVAHSAVETHSATAKVESGKVTVWVSTQAPFTVRTQVAQALGFTPQNVRVITPFVGAGFGGKTSGPQAVEAARIARLVGRPVQVVWDRAEEFFYDTFRPAAVVKIRSGLATGGKIVLWDYKVYCAGDREARQFYDVPHQRTISAGGWSGSQPPGLHPFGVGPWRAPSVNTNTFARESHVDIMAAKAGVDPVEFRLRNLTDRRMRRVLEAAAKQFGWKPGRAPSGRGVGVSCAIYRGTYDATIAEIVVDKASGRVQVRRVACAQDMGVIVNPDGARQQIEGSITMGLGYALTEEVHFKDGEVLEKNFDTYEIPKFSWVPRIETILIDNPEVAAQGGGEPPIVNMGAVIANAIFDAVGARLFQLPMTPARIKEALKKS
jgi:nicotinate dehydrogenase subunit B